MANPLNELPLPWTTQRLDDHTILVMAANRSVVTSVGTWNNRDPEPVACLIAAAQELLSFIRDDLSNLADALPGHETHPLEKYRLALIAKAEGNADG